MEEYYFKSDSHFPEIPYLSLEPLGTKKNLSTVYDKIILDSM